VLFLPKRVPNKRYTPEFKKLVVKTMQKKLSYRETARQFEINDDKALSAA
jgi:transposase